MSMAGKKIIDFLEKKKAQRFTGCVKMVFEDGKLALVQEANHLDFPMTKVFSPKAVFDLVATTQEETFCGTLIFSFSHGQIEFYSFLRSFKGEAIDVIMGERKQGGKKK